MLNFFIVIFLTILIMQMIALMLRLFKIIDCKLIDILIPVFITTSIINYFKLKKCRGNHAYSILLYREKD